jgi:hypothetical protein
VATEVFPVIERGTPGASADRKYAALRTNREKHAKQKLGRRLGGLYLALSTQPQSTTAWGAGGQGERALGAYLESIHDGSRIFVLHDRRIPGSRANIDHIAVCPSGIYVIDAKNYNGKVQRIDKGGWFTSDPRLYVGRRDCTKLIARMSGQVQAVRSLASSDPGNSPADVHPVICFVKAEWSLFAKPFVVGGVWIGWAKALEARLTAKGPLAPDRVSALATRLASGLSSA